MGELIIIRGGGDMATGVAQKFFRSGFKVLILESSAPTAIRRTVALCEAVYNGVAKVEDMVCRRADSIPDISWENGEIPLLVDPNGESIKTLRPAAVIDAIIAKRNLGTNRQMAPVTIGLGPGFTAGVDVDVVIETMRGHDLGRLILEGAAMPNTGVPGLIGGKSAQRVIYSPAKGKVKHNCAIGDVVQEGDILFHVDDIPAPAPFTGLVRGLIRDGMMVPKGMKSADIDPRTNVDIYTVSDKARCIGGGALEAFLYMKGQK